MSKSNITLPFDSKFQAGLINLLVTDIDFFRSIIDDLSEKHFDQGEAYIKLMRLIKKYWLKNKTNLTVDIVKNYLLKLTKADVISEPEHHGMLQILESGRLLAPTEFQYIKDNTVDFLKKQTVALAFGEAISAYEIADYDKMYDIIGQAYKKSYTIGDSLGTRYAEQDVLEVYSEPPRKNVFSSGFTQLDSLCDGGFATSECYTVVSATGAGKTSLLTNFAVAAMKQKKKVLYITLEMSEKQIEMRYDAIQSGFSISEITNAKDIQQELDKFRRSLASEKPLIKYFTRGSLSISMLRNYLDKVFTTEGKQDLVFLDWLACMKIPRATELRFDEALASIADELVNISREYEICLITCMQGNRLAIGNLEFNSNAVSASYASLFGMDLVLGMAVGSDKTSGKRRINLLKSRLGVESYINIMGDQPGQPLTYRFKEMAREEEEADLLTEKENKKK